jgi:hypothetical protein
MEMMHSRDGDESESGFGWLESRAGEFVHELMEEFGRKENSDLRLWN